MQLSAPSVLDTVGRPEDLLPERAVEHHRIENLRLLSRHLPEDIERGCYKNHGIRSYLPSIVAAVFVLHSDINVFIDICEANRDKHYHGTRKIRTLVYMT